MAGQPAIDVRVLRLKENPIGSSGKRGKPRTEFDEKWHFVLETSKEHPTLTMEYIENMRRIWHFLGRIRFNVRPGWWTLKRWVEFMWFRKVIG